MDTTPPPFFISDMCRLSDITTPVVFFFYFTVSFPTNEQPFPESPTIKVADLNVFPFLVIELKKWSKSKVRKTQKRGVNTSNCSRTIRITSSYYFSEILFARYLKKKNHRWLILVWIYFVLFKSLMTSLAVPSCDPFSDFRTLLCSDVLRNYNRYQCEIFRTDRW